MLSKNDYVDIKSEKMHYSFGYYSQNCWVDSTRVVLVRSESGEISRDTEWRVKTELVLCDVNTGNERVIAEGVNAWFDYAVFGETVYYIKDDELLALNVNTGAAKTMFREPGIAMPHVTKDGKFLSVFHCTREKSEFFRISAEYGNGEVIFSTAFDEPFPYANHGMISPTDPDILFFSHEGDTKHISDRLWIYDRRQARACNIAKQRRGENGEVLDCYGHECWSQDGKGLYFVRYRESEAPSGICYVDISTGAAELVYGSHDYWHVSVSPDGKYLAADTRNLGGDTSGVVVIDKASGKEVLADKVKTSFRHPCHPHPAFSPDNSKLIYHILNEHEKCSVRIRFLK